MTRQASDLDHLAEDIAREQIAQEKAAKKTTYEKAAKKAPVSTPAKPSSMIPVSVAAGETIDRLQIGVQVAQQQLQAFVDGLAMGQNVPKGAQLARTQEGTWVWAMEATATPMPGNSNGASE